MARAKRVVPVVLEFPSYRMRLEFMHIAASKPEWFGRQEADGWIPGPRFRELLGSCEGRTVPA